jgi:hypothetical protein
MPLFIDIHEIPGVTTEVAAAEHIKDIEAQGPFAVDYNKYWINEQSGKIFCMCEAPSMEAAMEVHRIAHGTGADRIIEVTPDLVELFMGPSLVEATGAALLPPNAEGTYDTGTRTFLFTDIVGSTELTQRLGDDASFQLVAVHDRIVRDALAANGGREVKHTGDGIMAVFVSAAFAIRAAIDMQRAFVNEAFDIRIGLAAGEPVERQGDFFWCGGAARGALVRAGRAR